MKVMRPGGLLRVFLFFLAHGAGRLRGRARRLATGLRPVWARSGEGLLSCVRVHAGLREYLLKFFMTHNNYRE
jgi:hypothetical protein